MIRKIELLLRLADVEDRLDLAEECIKDLEKRVKKLEKPVKTTKSKKTEK